MVWTFWGGREKSLIPAETETPDRPASSLLAHYIVYAISVMRDRSRPKLQLHDVGKGK